MVIPPMHICPGDLLVYSKVLNNRSDLLGKNLLAKIPHRFWCKFHVKLITIFSSSDQIILTVPHNALQSPTVSILRPEDSEVPLNVAL